MASAFTPNAQDRDWDLVYKANVALQPFVNVDAYLQPNAQDRKWDLWYKLANNIGNISTGGAITPEAFAALDLDSLPTSDPGGGKPWLNGGVVQVGP